MSSSPLYLGFDLSTQQLKAIVIDSQLKVNYEVNFEFDVDAKGYNVSKGVLTNEELHEVYAPVAMWLQAVDVVMERLKDKGLDFSRIKAISGAGQQHGSVYWSAEGENALQGLDSSKTLEKQLDHAFSHPYSPNWQDASTQAECDLFDKELSSEEQLAQATGSKAHHRFTGPQILRFQRRNAEAYSKTSRISLVSSWLASIFLGKIAPIDISDVCGANLWDIHTGNWNKKLLSLASNGSPDDLARKLGSIPPDGGENLGPISKYFVQRYGFSSNCRVVPFTGDNPSTILALPLRPGDAMVSLGTSTTFLMSTQHYKPDPAVHFFNHPATTGLYMFMLCYKNGGLAREQVRDAINGGHHGLPNNDTWALFNDAASTVQPANQIRPGNDASAMQLGLFFPRPEIVPNVRSGTWRYTWTPATKTLEDHSTTYATSREWAIPFTDARTIIESQLLSLRLRSRDIVETPPSHPEWPPQPRRVYLVGGGSKSPVIAKIAGEVLGGSEGVYNLDVGQNACALGAAYKAVWAAERKQGESFEELIGARWDETKFAKKVGGGYQEKVFKVYGQALEGFERMESDVVAQEHEKRKRGE